MSLEKQSGLWRKGTKKGEMEYNTYSHIHISYGEECWWRFLHVAS
jgi:hypothetical protein